MPQGCEDALDGVGSVEDAGATAGGLLLRACVRSRVRSQEKASLAALSGINQREAVLFSFEDGQAVQMRTQSEAEHVGAIQQQMVRRDGRCELVVVGARFFSDEVDGLFRRDMLKGDAEGGESLGEGRQVSVDEQAFAVEDIGAVIGDLAVDGEGEIVFLHLFEKGVELRQVFHAVFCVGRSGSEVEFSCKDASFKGGFKGGAFRIVEPKILDSCLFGEEEGHEGLEGGRAVRENLGLP